MLDMSLDLHFKEIELSEFDRAVLATVLTKGRSLREQRRNRCQLLRARFGPLAVGKEKPVGHEAELKKLYDDAGVWVYSDFTLRVHNGRRVFDSHWQV